MHAVALVSSVVVGVTLLAAGLFKLAGGAVWPQQAAELGVPRSVAAVVPWAEVVVGATNIVPVLLPWSAWAAGALLVAFTVLVLRRLRDGSRPPCACFGLRSSQPLGWRHVVRNAGLIVLAGLAAVWA